MKDLKRFIECARSRHKKDTSEFYEKHRQANMLAENGDDAGSIKLRLADLSSTVKDIFAGMSDVLLALEDICDKVCGDKKNEVRVHLDSSEFVELLEKKGEEFKEIVRKCNESLFKTAVERLNDALKLAERTSESIHDEQVREHQRACEHFTVVLKNYMRENWSEELKKRLSHACRIDGVIMSLLDKYKASREIKKDLTDAQIQLLHLRNYLQDHWPEEMRQSARGSTRLVDVVMKLLDELKAMREEKKERTP